MAETTQTFIAIEATQFGHTKPKFFMFVRPKDVVWIRTKEKGEGCVFCLSTGNRYESPWAAQDVLALVEQEEGG